MSEINIHPVHKKIAESIGNSMGGIPPADIIKQGLIENKGEGVAKEVMN